MNSIIKDEKKINILAFLGFFAWLFIGSIFFIIPIYIIGPKVAGVSFFEYSQNIQLVTEHTYVAGVLGHLFGIAIFVIFFNKIIKQDAKVFKNNWLKFLIIIVVGTGLLYFSDWIMNIIYTALGFGENDTSSNQQGIIDALNGSTKYFVVFYTVILAPIFEEIVFRKFFYGALKQNTKLPVWLIVIIISVVFAGIHVISDIESLVYFPQYFTLALIITAAYAISKENLYVSTGLHFVNNLIAVISLL